MSLSLGFSLSCSLICRCCRNLIDSERQREAAVTAMLFGATRYAVCPSCKQEVPREQWDRAYKARWRRAVKRKQTQKERGT